MHGRVLSLTLSEVFGPTIQGEGPSSGRRCGFVRLGRCNLTCVWCDTAYTWDWRGLNGDAYDPLVELSRSEVPVVVEEILAMEVPMVVITGGEPLLQQRGLADLCRRFSEEGLRIEVETNGTIEPTAEVAELVDGFNVGLKLANSGVSETRRLDPVAIDAFVRLGASFKFVASATGDLAEIHRITDSHSIPADRVWVMPQGTTAEQVIGAGRLLADAVCEAGWNLSTRLHVLAWGDTRGR